MAHNGVLFFSSDDWNSGLKTSKFHMASCLARDGYRVLYVNSIGLRAPQLSARSARKVLSRLRSVLGGVRRVEENIYVLTPLIVPFHRWKAVNAVNRWLLVWYVRLVQRWLGIRAPELWLFLPNHAGLPGAFGERVSLYYCVDEHTLFDGVDVAAMQALERRLVGSVDLLVATAESLLRSKQVLAKHSLYLPHGVDVEHFRRALDPATPLPPDIQALPRPLVGFFGLIEAWIDIDLVAHAARANPQISFVLIGKVVVETSHLAGIENLHFLGPRPFATLPAYCKAFACGLIPFKLTEMTLNVNPLKMREYLAAGLPVVSTDLPEVRHYGDVVRIARDPDEFAEAVAAAVADPTPREAISRLMDAEGWWARYTTLRGTIEEIVAAGVDDTSGRGPR